MKGLSKPILPAPFETHGDGVYLCNKIHKNPFRQVLYRCTREKAQVHYYLFVWPLPED